MKPDTIVKLRDAFTMASLALQEELESQMPKDEKTKSTVNLNAIKWQPATGPHGAYEKTLDLTNPEYGKLYAELIQHDGKMTLDGWFIWAFGEGGGIGRKLKQRRTF